MMKRVKSSIFGITIWLYSGFVAALGLGDITLKSSLNEPLNAEVRLFNIGELSEVEMLVNLASPEDFARAGVTREFHLVDLQFSVDLDEPEKPLLRVTSTKPIREPYLNFLIDLQWPTGKLLREYTIFLDLPVFAATKPAVKSSSAPVKSSSEGFAGSRDRRSNQPADPAIVSSATSGGRGENKYLVQGGDTLWGIARKLHPAGTSLQQTMLAIYESNGNAFINGDMNLIKKGALLSVPDSSAVLSVDQDQARRSVAKSAEEYGRSDGGTQVGRELVGDGAVISSQDASGESSGVLRLSPPESDAPEADVTETVGTGDALQGARGQGNESGTVDEELAKARQENLELKDKLARLEEQLATVSRLVEIEDDELGAVQEVLGESDVEVDDIIAEQDKVAAVQPDEIIPDMGAVSQKPVDEGLFASLKNNLSLIAAALLLVVLGVLFLLARNRKSEIPVHERSYSAERGAASPARDAGPAPYAADRSATAAAEAEPDEDRPTVDLDSSLILADDEKVDPIGEADIHLSVGNYSQAEEVITKALDGSPEDSRLHLKLLDLMAAQGDIDRFDAYYPRLAALGDRTVIDNADRLRASLIEAGYSPANDGVAAEIEQVATELPESEDLEEDFDLELELQELESEQPAPQNRETDVEKSLADMELDLEDEPAVIEQTEKTLASEDNYSGVVTDQSDFDDYGLDDDLDMMAEGDEIATQLELAQAYIDMGDKTGARDILNEVMANGDAGQRAQAQEIMKQIP